jgi:[histone H3]-lysine4 N-trimethyltransferase ASH1L
MPFRQTLLSFAAALASPKKKETHSRSRPSTLRTGTDLSDASDIIEVQVKESPLQLPTPEETATEASSVTSAQDTSATRDRRLSKRLSKSKPSATPRPSPRKDHSKNRNVSGETLVNNASESQDSLLKKGIDSLNLPWNMSDVFNTGSKANLVKSSTEDAAASTGSLDTVTPDEEEEEEEEEEDSEYEKERAAKAAAKKKKMADNNKLWEKRRKLADKHATRRSSRASMLTKATDLAAGIADSVLGKRKDRVGELRTSPRTKRTINMLAGEEPDAKKRRVSDSGATSAPQTTIAAPTPANKKAPRPPKDKKWLTSGLYAGQQRSFDARHHGGSKGKRKSTSEGQERKENSIMPLPMFFGERLLKEGRDFKLPFDVFSPLPAGQPKPDEWRKSNKNVFVGDAAQEWRVTKQMEYSACICTPETGCDQDCMNRYMYYECDNKNCNLSAGECGNRAFEDLRARVKKGGKYNIGVEVIKTASRGYGVRSNRTFDPNQIIVEYSGEVINQDECDRRMRREYKNNEVSCEPFDPVRLLTLNSATI